MNTHYGSWSHKTLYEVFSTDSAFWSAYSASGVYLATSTNRLTQEQIKTLYWLLLARYGNDPIASDSENQFKARLWATIFTHGPVWARRLEIQDTLRTMSEADLMAGSKTIFNHAYNPGTAPSTASLDELEGINEQNTNGTKRGKLEAYASLATLLEKDVTTEFLARFQPLFNTTFVPVCPDETEGYEALYDSTDAQVDDSTDADVYVQSEV